MRRLFAAAILALAAGGPASAQSAKNYAFCSVTSGIGTDCIFDDLAQCQQTIQGEGGFRKHGSGFDAARPMGTASSRSSPTSNPRRHKTTLEEPAAGMAAGSLRFRLRPDRAGASQPT